MSGKKLDQKPSEGKNVNPDPKEATSQRGQRSDQANIPPSTDDRGGRQSSGDAPRTGRNDKNEKR